MRTFGGWGHIQIMECLEGGGVFSHFKAFTPGITILRHTTGDGPLLSVNCLVNHIQPSKVGSVLWDMQHAYYLYHILNLPLKVKELEIQLSIVTLSLPQGLAMTVTLQGLFAVRE